jgi:hypothetical protein
MNPPRHARSLVLIACLVMVLAYACAHAFRQNTSPSSVNQDITLPQMANKQVTQASFIGLDPYPGVGGGGGEIGILPIIEDPAAQLTITSFIAGPGPYYGGQSFQAWVSVRNSGTIALYNLNVYLTFGGYPYLSIPSMTAPIPLNPGSILTSLITVMVAADATTQDPVMMTAHATGSNGMAFASAPPVSINIAIIAAAPPNQPPIASFTMNMTSALVDEVVSFTSTSSDPDGSIVSWSWDFGDGISGSGSSYTHAYAAAGNYTATLVVEDDGGAEVIASLNITINDLPGNGDLNELSIEPGLINQQNTLIASNTIIFFALASAGFVLVRRNRRLASRRDPDSLT